MPTEFPVLFVITGQQFTFTIYIYNLHLHVHFFIFYPYYNFKNIKIFLIFYQKQKTSFHQVHKNSKSGLQRRDI
jgi:hypothetical protein